MPHNIFTAVLASLPPTIAAVASLIQSIRNSAKIKDIHVNINSRMSELLQTNKQAAYSAGQLDARAGVDAPAKPNDIMAPGQK